MGANTKDAPDLPGLILARRRRRLSNDLLVKSSPNDAASVVFGDWLFDAAATNQIDLLTASFSYTAEDPQLARSQDFSTATFTYTAQAFSNVLSNSFNTSSFGYTSQAFSNGLSQGFTTPVFTFTPLAIDYTSGITINYDLNQAAYSFTGQAFGSDLSQNFSSGNFGYVSYAISSALDANYQFNVASFSYSPKSINSPVAISLGQSLVDIIYQKLKANNYTGTVQDMLFAFYGGAGESSLQDAERLWLIALIGASTLSNEDLWREYLASFGYSGSLQDMMKQYWINY